MNNFFRYRDFFAKRVIRHLGLSTTETRINNYSKKNVCFMGRIDRTNVIFFIIILLFYILICSANFSKVIGNFAFVIGSIVALGSSILVLITRKIKFKKLIPQPISISIYERELPSKLRPAHVRMLLEDGLVDEISLAATLLDLVDRGYLTLSYTNVQISKFNLFKNKDIIIARTNKPVNNLFQFEIYLLDWFLGYNDGISISQKRLHYGLNSDSNNDNIFPSDKMKHFQALVLTSFPIEKYFNKVKNQSALYLIFAILGFVPSFSYIGGFLGIYGMGCMFFAAPTYVLNQNGVDEIAKWKALRNYLIEFGNIKEKNTEMIALWDYYLVYSIVLGIPSIANEELNDFFGTQIFKGVHNKERKIQSTNEDIEELGINFKEWYSVLEQERQKELSKYN